MTLHDTIKDLTFKVDMRILHDRISQHHNVESEVEVVEAAEEDPEDIKFNSDRCKVLIENKAIVDRYLMEGCFVDNVDSLQICGLKVFFFINLALQHQGLYVGTQFYHAAIDSSLNNLGKYMDLSINLLCFGDNCLTISNKYESHIISVWSKKKSTRRRIQEQSDDELSTKQNWIRDSWNPLVPQKPRPHLNLKTFMQSIHKLLDILFLFKLL